MRKKLKTNSRKSLNRVHYTEQYLLNPVHPVTVKVIGCGGNGSQMLQALARINVSLIHLGHPGFLVQAWDDDRVTDANMGRQLFSKSDVGQYKAKILIERINRFYGFNWQAFPLKYDQSCIKDQLFANIFITCVDNVSTRRMLYDMIDGNSVRGREPYSVPIYWLDLGNSKSTGQVVLGTFGKITQPKRTRNTVTTLPTILHLFPDMQKFEDKDTTPSCSLAEALDRQDLFINSTLVQYGAQLIWRMFRDLKLHYHGLFLNLDTLNTNPIMIKAK